MSIRKLVVAGTVLAALAAVVPAMVAAHHEEQPAAYTGCLSDDGKLVAFAAGNSPKRACTSSERSVHLSGGDITSIQAGPGVRIASDPLGLSDNSGPVRIELGQRYRLPNECESGQTPVWAGTAWSCTTPPVGPKAIERFVKTSRQVVGNDWATVGSVEVPAGSWELFGRVHVDDGDNDEKSFIDCRLDVTGKPGIDNVTMATADGTAYVDSFDTLVTLASFHTSSQPFVAAVVCRDSYYGNSSGETGMYWDAVRIHAVPVAGFQRVS
jgi:hypothetical protein